jgi:SAM-dependent methyltransferase
MMPISLVVTIGIGTLILAWAALQNPDVSLFARRAANRLFLREWTKRRKAGVVAELTEAYRLPPEFAGEIGFWALELSGHGYHPEILRRLDPQGMKECFPEPVSRLIPNFAPRIPRVADVGSGPLSQLAYGAYRKSIDLTAIDPLINLYGELLRDRREPARYERLAIPAEEIAERCGRSAFDIVWTRNAIDHARQPSEAFRSMVDALAPGGYLLLSLFSREGTAEGFHGLHQHDLFLNDENQLMVQSLIEGQLTQPVCASSELPLEVVSSTGPTGGVKQWFEIVWRKKT